jgi:soluble lytic murein transglycosylase-like protein
MATGWILKYGLAITIFAVVTFIVIPCPRADIYVYIDSQGVMHFTNTPTSDNYKVYIHETPHLPDTWHDTREYDDVITEAARKNGLSFSLLKALILVESCFNPRAVSKKGALGLTQIMPQNLQLLNINDPFDPWENIMGGARYLKAMLERFNGHLPLALAAYNAGPTVVEKYNSIPPFKETQTYVERVLKFFHYYKKS